ncbi:MAG: AMP-binding protein [bacterium]
MQNRTLSYDYGKTEDPLLYTPIGDYLGEIAQRVPQNDALVSVYQDKRFTYREFDRITSDFAKGLMRLGIAKGDRVGIWAVNRWEWVLTQFATAKMGAILVNINPAYRTHELKYALQQSGTQTLILMDSFKQSQYREMLLSICPEADRAKPGALQSAGLPQLRNLILLDERHPGMFTFDEVLQGGREVPDEDLARRMAGIDPDDDINIQYTSGTTGFPKGVTLTHFNILNNGYHIARVMRFTEQDRLCIPVPFYHCFGMVLSNLACVTAGATMVIPSPSFEPIAVFEAVVREKCTALHGVPTMFIAELNHPDFGKYDLCSLRTGIMAGAPCPIETMKEVIAKMNMQEVVIAYGQTESSPVTTMTRIEDAFERRVSSVGRVMPWQELKITDPVTGATVERGQQGELCFRGYQVMSRYYNNPAATEEAIDPKRWLHSGDLGTMDEAGYVKITGRIKEMVIRGGENVYPREIEEFLRMHPKIMDVYVHGVPDVKYGEELMAWVLPRSGEALLEEEMKEFCKGKIAHFKVPRYWKFVRSADDFPMTVTGKIQKFRMREIAIRELGLEEAARIQTA